ncbi:MAG: sigma-54 interaction domain-containing protein [Desulfohalobiaceae bacterium]
MLERMILESLAVGVFTVDQRFRITFFNQEAERMTGFSKAQAMGHFCAEIFRTSSCETHCPLQRAMQNGEAVVRERIKFLARNNQEMPVEVTAAALRDARGNLLGGVESFVDDRARTILEKKVASSFGFEDLKGRSQAMLSIYEILPSLAESDVSLLLLGETGTGKDLLAKVVHQASKQRNGPFIKVNCAALPENLLESELFGYQKGAFTDAKQDKPGRFQLARGGTLFLDEIGELPLSLQAKLLQALEDKEFYPLGATRLVQVDLRLIASTNKDLQQQISKGAFRPDLYYRLKVAELQLPPLRERKVDIPLLTEHFLQELCALQGKTSPRLDQPALRLLLAYDYPGNVRELRNILEYALLLSSESQITPEHLPAYLQGSSRANCPDSNPKPEEQDLLLKTLQEYGHNKTRAAQALGISRTTLWRRLRAVKG